MNGQPNHYQTNMNGQSNQQQAQSAVSRSPSNPAPQPTLPYAFSAQFEAIQNHENALYAIHPQHVTFRVPAETHVGSPMAPRPPYQHHSPTRPVLQQHDATSIATWANIPAPIRSRANSPTIPYRRPQRPSPPRGNTITHLSVNDPRADANARPGLQRTASHISNPEGFSQEMNATAIAMLEESSIEDVLRYFRDNHPELSGWERIREHLNALVIQFHG